MSTFTEAAAAVISNIEKVSLLLKELQLPEPTFDESGSDIFDTRGCDTDSHRTLRTARNALINATQDLTRLTMGPMDHILSMALCQADSSNIGCLVRMNIPARIPPGACRTIVDLSQELGLPEHVFSNLVRCGIENGVFCEPESGVIAHTAASALLRKDSDMHDYCMMSSNEIGILLARNADLTEKKELIGVDGFSSANLAFPEFKNVFEYFGSNPVATKRYFTYLAARSRLPRWSADYLIDAWDWELLKEGPLVDVGGSAGSSSLMLANVFCSLRFISQDISDEAMDEGKALAEARGLQRSIDFMKHDFFTPQPIKAPAYLLKNIFHDWSDKECVRIIEALLPALESGAHVLIGELIVPEPPAVRVGTLDGHAIRLEDQLMLAAHGASERYLAQFRAIVEQASTNLRFLSARRGGNSSLFWLLDFVYEA